MRITKNGDVHVSAPIGLPKKQVVDFIEQHQDWIDEARKKTSERQKQRANFYNQLSLTTQAQRIEAWKKLKVILEPMVEKYSKEMGVTPSTVSCKPMISRWGRCNVS